MAERRLRLGIAGLGRGFSLMRPTFVADPRIALAAAADPRAEARHRFAAEFGAPTHESVAALCADPSIEAVYVATPHQFHAHHAIAAATAGKHVLVEKPMALTLDECRSMIAAAQTAGIHLIVGHSHSFDAPIAATRRLVAEGCFGPLRMVTALNFTDFLYRPRRPEELDTQQGGGVVFSQAAHQIDIVRLLAGGRAQTVRASVGRWDPARPTEGAYTAFITFAGGVTATLTYSGYGHFDSDELCGWIGESGAAKDAHAYGGARKRLRTVADQEAEARLKASGTYGGAAEAVAGGTRAHEHFGFIIASCAHADLRPLPDGIMIYGDEEHRLLPLPRPAIPRVEVIDELYAAVVSNRPPLHSGTWAMATLEICLALLRSAETVREIPLRHQTALEPAP